MLLIDFAKLNHQRLNMTMADLGITDFSNLPFTAILERLELGSSRIVEEFFPSQPDLGKVDLSPMIHFLLRNKKITDVIGSTKISLGMPICFSTFVSPIFKEYLKQYVEVMKILYQSSCDLSLVTWLEDTMSILKNDWQISEAQRAIGVYTNFFSQELPYCRIMLSSQAAPMGIPQDFIQKLTCVNIEEFLSILPFHLRSPIFVKVLDIVHFSWNCYILNRLSGVYLVGVNNKRHFQLFRKVVGSKITAILLPIGSEEDLV